VVRFILIFLLLTTSAFAADGDPILLPLTDTANRLTATDASKEPAAVTNLCSWVTGSASILCTDDGDGTSTYSVIAGGVDHGGLAGLLDDDHTQYALLLGRGGETLNIDNIQSHGGTGNDLTLYSNSANDSSILFGAGMEYDEATGFLGIGVSPASPLHVYDSRGTINEPALHVESNFAAWGSGYNVAEYYNDGTLVSELQDNAAQRWYLTNSSGVAVGQIAYATPGGEPGIAISNAAGEYRMQWKLYSLTAGGMAWGAAAGAATPTDQARFTTQGRLGLNWLTGFRGTFNVEADLATVAAGAFRGAASQSDPIVEIADSSNNVLHSFAAATSTDPTTYLNQHADDIDTIIKTANVADAFKVDAGTDSVQTNTGRQKKTTRIEVGATPYVVLATDHIIYCDTDGGAIEVDLPAGTNGREFRIINVGSSGNDCTIDPNGAEQLYAAGAGVAFAMHDTERIIINYETTEGWW
jgi:hypothetical protein